VERAWRALEREVRADFAPAERRGLALERWAEARYHGPSHEVALAGGPGLVQRFHREHERRYGFADRSRAVEVVTLEVRGATPDAWRRVARRPAGAARGAAPRPSPARVWAEGRWRVAPVWERAALRRGLAVRGPAVVADAGATLWVAPGWTARLHASGAVVVTRGGAR